LTAADLRLREDFALDLGVRLGRSGWESSDLATRVPREGPGRTVEGGI